MNILLNGVALENREIKLKYYIAPKLNENFNSEKFIEEMVRYH